MSLTVFRKPKQVTRRHHRRLQPPSVRAVLRAASQRPTARHLLVVDEVVKIFRTKQEVRGLHGVSFCVQPGEFVFIVGPTGHGKTTLLRLIRGEMRPDEGEISIGGIDIATIDPRAYKRKVGMVAQTLDTLPLLTVEENIRYPLECLRWHPKDIERRTRELLQVFGLMHAKDRLCDDQELSGGERQRLSIARAIAHRPDLLLCDEPTGHLDARTTYGVLRTLNRVSMLGTTVLCVTHDPMIVNLMQKRVLLLKDGRIVSDTIGGYPVF